MKVNTRDFGEIEVDDKQVIEFPFGILGFPEHTKFVLLDSKQPPFYYLQSLIDVDLVFVLISPEVFKKDYVFNVSDSELEEIKVTKKNTELIVFAIVNFNNSSDKNLTANLQGPIVINRKEKIGRQCIALNEDYSLKHNIIEEMNKKENN